MTGEHELFGDRLRQLIERPGAGARMQNSSTGSSTAGGNAGTHGSAVTRPTNEGITQREWLMGDAWTDQFYFRDWEPI